MPTCMTLAEARARWILAQQLDSPARAQIVPTLERTGMIRTLGGVEVYLALAARVPRFTAKALHEAVASCKAQVIPAARGCIYLAARRYVPVSLRLADALSGARSAREREKAGIESGEIARVAKAVMKLIAARGPLGTDAIRKGLPEGTLRSLGERGKKAGLSSPLPPALRALELEGKIERTLEGGRLDTERHLWRIAGQSPFADGSTPSDRPGVFTKIAEVFFRAAGLGQVRELAEWAGISLRDARAAADSLGLESVEVEGQTEPFAAIPGAIEGRSAIEHAREAVALLPFEDTLTALRGGPRMLVDPRHQDLEVPSWGAGGSPTTLGNVRHMQMRALVADGRIAGLWDYDLSRGEVVFATFEPAPAATRARIEDRAQAAGRLLRDELGHARCFTLDTDQLVQRRADFVRCLQGTGRGKARSSPEPKAGRGRRQSA